MQGRRSPSSDPESGNLNSKPLTPPPGGVINAASNTHSHSAAIREILGDFDALYAAPDNADAARLYARIGEKVVGEDIAAAAPLECLYYLDQGYGVYSVEF